MYIITGLDTVNQNVIHNLNLHNFRAKSKIKCLWLESSATTRWSW